jgi:GNAT superfamily N-acetyltransferase
MAIPRGRQASDPPAVRLAGLEDVAAIEAIVERAYTPYVPLIGRRPAPMDDVYAPKVRGGQVFVAERGAVVGVIVLVDSGDHLLIENVAVDPESQHRGIGRALLAFAEAHAASVGVAELRLYTNEAMHDNLRLYPRLGYVETGRGRGAGFNRVYFRKRLDHPKSR